MPGVSDNLLLGGLSHRIRQPLLRGAEPVVVRSGDLLETAGERAAQAIFPIDCSISLLLAVDGEPVEAGLIGDEGMLGIPLVLGTRVSAFRAVVQGSGRAWCIDAAHFTAHLERHPALHQRLNRYVYVRMLQLAQGAACRSFHLVEQRLARWLLMSRDRAHSDQLTLTHEVLGQLLGARRAGVTIAAHALQDRHLIRYARGRIRVLDARGLESAACSCYANEKQIYARSMG
jgi:CRP-like cAMP-binding protein